MGKERKDKKIIAVLIITILVAVISGAALYLYLSPQKTTIYVFKDNYSSGTVVTSEMLTAIQCDAQITVAGKNADASSRFVTGADLQTVLNTGDALRMDVVSGMPLTLSMLSVNGGSSVEMQMDPAKIAITVPVSNTTGVTSELKEGSRVNVYTSGIDASGITLLFQNMRIISVNKSDGNLSSVTIECTADESLKLVYAATYSSIYLGLIDSSGYEYTQEETPSYSPTSSTAAIEPQTSMDDEATIQ